MPARPQEPFQDPVIASDSYTYERAAIAAWVEEHGTSPVTGERLELAQLRPNHAVRDVAESLLGAAR